FCSRMCLAKKPCFTLKELYKWFAIAGRFNNEEEMSNIIGVRMCKDETTSNENILVINQLSDFPFLNAVRVAHNGGLRLGIILDTIDSIEKKHPEDKEQLENLKHILGEFMKLKDWRAFRSDSDAFKNLCVLQGRDKNTACYNEQASGVNWSDYNGNDNLRQMVGYDPKRVEE
ncbi:MAG: hypothetical protein MJ218_03055, partial [Opitutales bacterium]|nr:hypothetical protein [Opitutales bacterium]